MADDLFCGIVAGEVPATVVAETDRVLAFRDINPQAPTHVLVIPKSHYPDVASLAPDYPFSETRIFEEPGYPVLHFVEQRYSHDPTNWWIPNRACAEAMLRSAGFEIAAHPEGDVYICKRIRHD